MPMQCLDRDISIDSADTPVSVTFNGREIARTNDALSLKEATYPPVLYIPLEDVDAAVLSPSDHKSVCPFKGEASYYDLKEDEKTSENAVWYYPDPCPLVEKIRGHVAFWGDDIAYVS